MKVRWIENPKDFSFSSYFSHIYFIDNPLKLVCIITIRAKISITKKIKY